MRVKYIVGIVALLMATVQCRQAKKTDWSISLSKDNKAPMGTYVFYNMLQRMYSTDTMLASKRITNYDYKSLANDDEVKHLKIVLAQKIEFTDDEFSFLLDYIKEGNYLLVAASNIDERLLQHFQLMQSKTLQYNYGFLLDDEELDSNLIKTEQGVFYKKQTVVSQQDTMHYTNGLPLRNHIEEGQATEDAVMVTDNGYDYEIDEVLPKNAFEINRIAHAIDDEKKMHGLTLRYGSGKLLLVANAEELSNHFLLQRSNKVFAERLLSELPSNLGSITWHQYKTRTVSKDAKSKDPITGLSKYPMWRYAFLLAGFGILLYVLFGLKRKQREIAIITPNTNTSVEFAETIGQLYYNKADHKNLAEKMTAHFLETVRSKYNIVTNKLDPAFAQMLAKKMGAPEQELLNLCDQMSTMRNMPAIQEYQLVQLYHSIQQLSKYLL